MLPVTRGSITECVATSAMKQLDARTHRDRAQAAFFWSAGAASLALGVGGACAAVLWGRAQLYSPPPVVVPERVVFVPQEAPPPPVSPPPPPLASPPPPRLFGGRKGEFHFYFFTPWRNDRVVTSWVYDDASKAADAPSSSYCYVQFSNGDDVEARLLFYLGRDGVEHTFAKNLAPRGEDFHEAFKACIWPEKKG